MQKFNKEGEYLGQFGEAGSGEGQFSFSWRIGLAADAKGNIWVADTQNARVQKWRMPESGSTAPTKYKYDGAGNLISVERPEVGETQPIEESYAYDGTGLRASQTISGVTDPLTWDQSGGLPLLLDDGHASYIYGPNGLPIEQISEEEPTYYHHDQLGSTRALTDSSGEVTGAFSYGAYGEPIGRTGTQRTPLGYAGQYTNAESGLQYLRARVYDPATGQFLTRDPMEVLTKDPYGYVFANPTTFIDPSGMLTIGFCGSASAILTPIGAIGSGCLQVSSSGDVGVTLTGGPAAGAGSNIGGGPALEVANPDHVSELGGQFIEAGGSAGGGPGAFGQVFYSDEGCNDIYGVLAGPAADVGAGGFIGVTDTIQGSINIPSVIDKVGEEAGKIFREVSPF